MNFKDTEENEKSTMPEEIEGPPERIHVYYLEGVLPEDVETRFDSSFIGNWEEGASSFLFFRDPVDETIEDLVLEYPQTELIDSYEFLYEDWQGGCFKEFDIGPFTIRPAWSGPELPHKDKGLVIRMDPGVVFGSGVHPTTRDCLQAISWIWKRDTPRSILDLGTGTGILSIAGVLLGAESALAVDLNPLCVRTTRKNMGYNGCESLIVVKKGEAQDFVGGKADLVIANIHYSVIDQLVEMPEFLKRKWLVLSGLMRTQARDIKDRVVGSGLLLVREWDHDMTWHTMVFRHPNFLME